MSTFSALQTVKHKFSFWLVKPLLSCCCQGLLYTATIVHNILSQRDHLTLRELDLWISTEIKIWAGAPCSIISCYNESKAQNLCDLALTATQKSLMKSSTLNTDGLNSSWGEEDQNDPLPTLKFLCRKSSGISMAISSRNHSSVLCTSQRLTAERDSAFGSLLRLPWLNVDHLFTSSFTAVISALSVCWDWINQNESSHS